jgi:hypothetical protein
MKAFPSIEPTYGNNIVVANQSTGMDLRDYFAAKAMMIAIRLFEEQSMEIPYVDESGEPMDYEEGSFGTWYPQTKKFGQDCYSIADAMMEARNATK